MINENFTYKGFKIKINAHELFPGYGPSGVELGWYASSVEISRSGHGQRHYYKESLHPGRISVSPERAIDHGKKYAMHVVDEEVLYENLTQFLETRPI
jgi:hypothetical protein